MIDSNPPLTNDRKHEIKAKRYLTLSIASISIALTILITQVIKELLWFIKPFSLYNVIFVTVEQSWGRTQ